MKACTSRRKPSISRQAPPFRRKPLSLRAGENDTDFVIHPMEPVMKYLPTAAAAVLFAAINTIASAQTCAPIEVRNVRPAQGTLMVVAYTSEAEFNKKPATAVQLKTTDETLSFSMCLPTGSTNVALMMFQDINDNGKMDSNVLGIPSEPWGSSGKPSNFGPPNWAAAAVAVPADGKPVVAILSK
jgi:uncharacterized protein (DUF2141 family)